MENFTFDTLPASAAEMAELKKTGADSPYRTAALALLALMNYETDPDTAFAMLDVLKGPEPVSPYQKQFINERLSGKSYKVASFFDGATPENGYVPSVPYSITVYSNPVSFSEENWATMFVKSSGADSERQIKLRKKPSTGEWFLNDIMCLSDIRVPAKDDPWA